jgi:uncharacterized membrane protein YphA (DoxX/SURF4 family)
MKLAVPTARIMLGILFLAAGLSGWLMLPHPPPAPPGLPGQFQTVFFASRWVLFVDLVEIVAASFLLANRFVPLGTVLLGAIIPNIIVFHLTMQPAGLPVAFVVTALWSIVAFDARAHLAPLFAARVDPAPLPILAARGAR